MRFPILATSAGDIGPPGGDEGWCCHVLAIPVPERTGDSLAHSLRSWGMGHSGVGGLMLEGASEVAGGAPRGTLLPQGPLLAPELGVWWAQGGH